MPETKSWFRRQLRILQTVLREPDVVGYDAAAVVRYMETVRANCLVVNAGGVVDFFRHGLPAANPNPFMTTEDPLRDLTKACHEKGIKLIVRVDFRGVDKRIYELRPDWFAVDEHGKPVVMDTLFGERVPHPYYQPCYLSYYRNEHAYEFTKEIFRQYDIDGVWENSYQQFGICYCRTCQTRYKAEMGKELPRGGDYMSAVYDEYRDWKANATREHFRNFQKLIKTFGEDKTYCAEVFGLFHDTYKLTSTDLYSIKEHFDFLVTPMFAQTHLPLSAPSALMKFLKALDPEKTPVMIYGPHEAVMRYVSSAPVETRVWMWQAVSVGGSLWNTTFNGQHPAATYDRRNAYLCQEIYEYMERHEARLAKQSPVAEVEILYSCGSNRLFGSSDKTKDHYVGNLIGMEQVLRDNHIQYNILPDTGLSPERLAKTPILAIPNGAVLSDEQVAMIREYVRNGGKLLATYQTSLLREDGKERDDFALGDVFGCSYTGINKDNTRFGYQYIRGDHPLTKGFEETQVIASGGDNLLVRALPEPGIETPITYVPPIYWQPPERSWLNSMETDYPTAVVNRYGQGTAVYFPYEPDRMVWAHGHQDFSRVLANGFHYLMAGRQAITTNAPVSVQLSLNGCEEVPGGYILHAINLTSYPRRPIAQLIPVHQLEIGLRIPCRQLRKVEVMHGGQDGLNGVQLIGTKRLEDGFLNIELVIDKLEEYMAIWLETGDE